MSIVYLPLGTVPVCAAVAASGTVLFPLVGGMRAGLVSLAGRVRAVLFPLAEGTGAGLLSIVGGSVGAVLVSLGGGVAVGLFSPGGRVEAVLVSLGGGVGAVELCLGEGTRAGVDFPGVSPLFLMQRKAKKTQTAENSEKKTTRLTFSDSSVSTTIAKRPKKARAMRFQNENPLNLVRLVGAAKNSPRRGDTRQTMPMKPESRMREAKTSVMVLFCRCRRYVLW